MDPTTGSATAVGSQATYPGYARHQAGEKVVRAKKDHELLKDEVAPEDGEKDQRGSTLEGPQTRPTLVADRRTSR